MMENIIETKNLTKQYKDCTALEHADIIVQRGEIYGLIGANGAGKTTFLKLVAGQSFPTKGELMLFGTHEQKEQERQRKRTGVIIEQPGFYPQLSIEQNMEYYRIQKGIPGKRAIEETLKLVGLWDVRKKKGKTLSLGMKQRLGLGIALIGEPELLLLDEPINGLDPAGIIEIRNLLRRLNQEKHITIVISSHILSELEQLATTYGFLEKGHLMEQISARALQEKCGNYLEMKVTDTERFTVLLEKQMSHDRYLVLEDGTVRIFNPGQEVERYSAAAGKNGIGILSMAMKQCTLEDYYMNLKEEGKKHA
ncbi:MAG: ABC transporter ATP-binding protein [Lachnospiraceae bacterium]|nr:ABC transporter ATP-binding protein [Lachnospiraceae bacterium]